MPERTDVRSPSAAPPPLVEMRNIRVSFGGVHAVDGVTVDLNAGEVVGLVGGNGAGKSTLIRALSGAHPPDEGEIYIDGEKVSISQPARRAKTYGIETIYQTLALADNVDAAANLFLGRELTTRFGLARRRRHGVGDARGHGPPEPEVPELQGPGRSRCRAASASRWPSPARSTSTRRILIMDEPTAALGPAETAQVRDLVSQLKAQGIGIFLISHDIHDVFDLADRISVMLHGQAGGHRRQGQGDQGRGPGDDHHRASCPSRCPTRSWRSSSAEPSSGFGRPRGSVDASRRVAYYASSRRQPAGRCATNGGRRPRSVTIASSP